jgi:hypothetical protein
MVLVNPETRQAIANRPDPDGRFQKDGDVYTGVFPSQFTPANTAIDWKGQPWSTVTLPLPADPFLRLKLLAHESFHRIQTAAGLSASDAPDPALETEAGRLWLRLEVRALARALRETGDAGLLSARDAMLFREYRDLLCPGSASMESAMEKQEGLAEYTGAVIALGATGEDISRVARAVEAFEDGDAFARSFGYATGPALGLLLDRYAPGWRARAPSASLDTMLAASLEMPAPVADLGQEARQHAAAYGYSAVTAAEDEREARHQRTLGELTKRFLEGPTLGFAKSPELTRSFNPNSLVPFPPHGTYYPTGVFSASWGKLEVESGGALLAPDNMSVRVTAPPDSHARPLRGDGWVLNLAVGWTIRPSSRAGSFEVVPAR